MAVDYSPSVMKQYANSDAMVALLDSFAEWVDWDKFSDAFLTQVWDISSATGFGLDIWGRILGRSRYLRVQQNPGNAFGFDIGTQPGSNWQPFNVAPFQNGQASGTVSVALQDDAYRALLLVKAAANIASCDVPSLNALLRALFGSRGPSYVGYDADNPMHIGFTFDFFATQVEKSIIESGIFPVPAGMTVRFIYRTLTYNPFGFAGMNTGADPDYVTGFNQSPFIDTL